MTPSKDIQLSTLYDNIESHLRALESLGVTSDKCATMLFLLVESSLPEELLRAWQRSSMTHGSTARELENVETQAEDRLTQLIKFLSFEAKVQSELRISMAVKGFGLKSSEKSDSDKLRKNKNRHENRDVPSAMGLLSTKGNIDKCLFCDSSEHDSCGCEVAKKMSLEKRREVVKNKHVCFNCLKKGHSCKVCRSKITCAWCNRRHLIIMCPEEGKRDNVPEDSPPVTTSCIANQSSVSEVFLQTIKVKIVNGNNKVVV
ncbi:uncharacterized protein LOC122505433 [Leptopilina heterotoma]|uniref:uncharacterized protein LOC122505433 n=1 Tax=Leptopilina heterotoma TaxID=63436 RepID=UPI001CA8B51B|nr:uncharacterized protein LOC122505433 [Leptopilina heterotoma]